MEDSNKVLSKVLASAIHAQEEKEVMVCASSNNLKVDETDNRLFIQFQYCGMDFPLFFFFLAFYSFKFFFIKSYI